MQVRSLAPRKPTIPVRHVRSRFTRLPVHCEYLDAAGPQRPARQSKPAPVPAPRGRGRGTVTLLDLIEVR